jgi:formate hydrogenlyase subunit 6/NADH:ubiquinone oxidoreductase subunit I/flavodoxin
MITKTVTPALVQGGSMEKIKIFYYSGTGNSLHVARELQKRIPKTELSAIVSLLEKDNIIPDSDRIGIVFPVYVNSVPIQVRQFLSKLDPSNFKYIFAIATHGNYTNPTLSEILVDKLLKKRGKDLDSFFDIEMSVNTPRGIMPAWFPGGKDWADHIKEKNVAEKEKNVQKIIDEAVRIITSPKRTLRKSPSFTNRIKEKLITRLTGKSGREIAFHADSSCTGCGICQKVCLSRKIKMVGDRPSWKKEIDCFYCYACFNFCPEQAILVGKEYLKKDGRYHHPSVTASDIAGQKGT